MAEVVFAHLVVELPDRDDLRTCDTSANKASVHRAVVSRVAEKLRFYELEAEASKYVEVCAKFDTIDQLLDYTANWVTLQHRRKVPNRVVDVPPLEVLERIGAAAVDLLRSRVTKALPAPHYEIEAKVFDSVTSNVTDPNEYFRIINEWVTVKHDTHVVRGVVVAVPPLEVLERIGAAAVDLLRSRVTKALSATGHHQIEAKVFDSVTSNVTDPNEYFRIVNEWVTVKHDTHVAPSVHADAPTDTVLFSTNVNASAMVIDRVTKALHQAGMNQEADLYLADVAQVGGDSASASEILRLSGQWVQLDKDTGQQPPAPPLSPPPVNRSDDAHHTTPTVAAPGSTARRAGAVARFVEVAMWVALVLCVIGGLIIAFQKEGVCDVYDCSFSETYPLFGLGLAVAIVGAIQSAMIIMVASYIRARADGSIK